MWPLANSLTLQSDFFGAVYPAVYPRNSFGALQQERPKPSWRAKYTRETAAGNGCHGCLLADREQGLVRLRPGGCVPRGAAVYPLARDTQKRPWPQALGGGGAS